MTEDDIILSRTDVLSMAREAGLFVHKEVQPEIERFAALIASRVAAEEREACAKLCDASTTVVNDYTVACNECAWVIRTRGQP